MTDQPEFADYDPVPYLPKPLIAWEYLRRHPGYRRDWTEAVQNRPRRMEIDERTVLIESSGASPAAEAWGLRVFFQTRANARWPRPCSGTETFSAGCSRRASARPSIRNRGTLSGLTRRAAARLFSESARTSNLFCWPTAGGPFSSIAPAGISTTSRSPLKSFSTAFPMSRGACGSPGPSPISTATVRRQSGCGPVRWRGCATAMPLPPSTGGGKSGPIGRSRSFSMVRPRSTGAGTIPTGPSRTGPFAASSAGFGW